MQAKVSLVVVVVARPATFASCNLIARRTKFWRTFSKFAAELAASTATLEQPPPSLAKGRPRGASRVEAATDRERAFTSVYVAASDAFEERLRWRMHDSNCLACGGGQTRPKRGL